MHLPYRAHDCGSSRQRWPDALGQRHGHHAKSILGTIENKHEWFDIRLADESLAKQLELTKQSLAQKYEEADAMYESRRKN
jgi:hypothetical protein